MKKDDLVVGKNKKNSSGKIINIFEDGMLEVQWFRLDNGRPIEITIEKQQDLKIIDKSKE